MISKLLLHPRPHIVHNSTAKTQNVMKTKPLIKWKLSLCTLGSFIFLAIEGGASQMQQRTLASTNRQLKPSQAANNNNNINSLNSHSHNVTLSPAALQDVVEVRDRCVENIWDVTVSLNVLYRENWTRYVGLSFHWIYGISIPSRALLVLLLRGAKGKAKILGFYTQKVCGKKFVKRFIRYEKTFYARFY